MDTPVTKSDLWDLRDSLGRTLKEGFAGVYARQDATNGRVRQGEIQDANHSVRLQNIERELFSNEGGRRKGDPSERTTTSVTERDVKLVIGTLATAGTLIGFFWKVLPLLLKAMA
jgi:hypothetical protein